MARNGLLCADVPLRNYSLTHAQTPNLDYGVHNRAMTCPLPHAPHQKISTAECVI